MSRSKVFNTALVYQLQDDRLWGQREWTCNQLESAALAGQFNDDECGHARDIAVRFCNCRDKDWSPTVETTPVCEFCPGANPLDPQKWINTYVGGMTCQGKRSPFVLCYYELTMPPRVYHYKSNTYTNLHSVATL